MVYFECQACNETIKKPKLKKHLEICGSHWVSCIDCNKVFDWQSWEAHTSCVSEAQKYQGSLYQAKEKENKGQVKQDTWVENVQSRIEDPTSKIDPQIKSLLEKLMGFSNIPRKPKPFGNFVKNSLKIWDDKKIGQMWDVIAAANAKPAAAPANAKPAAAAPPNKAMQCVVCDENASPVRRWGGWKREVDAELESNSGELAWQKLRDALVAKYSKAGEANGNPEEVPYLALAEIPEEYLSRDDGLVRLPQSKKAKAA